MRDHHYAVYILASTYKYLYIGVTGNLEHRIATHKAPPIQMPSPPATASTASSTSSDFNTSKTP